MQTCLLGVLGDATEHVLDDFSQLSPSFHPQLRSPRQRGERRLRKGGQEKRSEGPGEMEVMEGAG